MDDILDWKLLEAAKLALEDKTPVFASFDVRNVDRTIGTLLSNEISKLYGFCRGCRIILSTLNLKALPGKVLGLLPPKGFPLSWKAKPTTM